MCAAQSGGHISHVRRDPEPGEGQRVRDQHGRHAQLHLAHLQRALRPSQFAQRLRHQGMYKLPRRDFETLLCYITIFEFFDDLYVYTTTKNT